LWKVPVKVGDQMFYGTHPNMDSSQINGLIAAICIVAEIAAAPRTTFATFVRFVIYSAPPS
jgi:hypothetical protein